MSPPIKNPKTLRAEADTEKLLSLERAGLTMPQMAAALKCSPARVHKLIHAYRAKEIERNKSKMSEAERLAAIDRCNAMILAHWDKRSNPANARIITDQQKLLATLQGLDAKRVDVTHGVDLGDDARSLILSGLARLASGSRASEGDSEPHAGSGNGGSLRVAGLLGTPETDRPGH